MRMSEKFMYVCLTAAFCDCIHGKGQHQLGQGERSVKEVPFSRLHKQTWLATHHWLSCSQLCSRALKLLWETMKRFSRTNPGPFAIDPSRKQTSQVGEITKSSPRRTLCKLWVCFFCWELEGTGADAGNTTSAQHCLTNLQIILQS